eukprot:TRINITY_DN66404_c2_g1_i2.p1 TRINITY_DN66404_c2_g1~~TRINITY_DN66404_c2_g1_i2.p1  ORF type:complete len:348 (+),score=35.18 TRINITY_DN66404_c2_g1_i2:49-1092(+)
MDIDRMLNFEKRTGIKNEQIEDFVDKASAVQDAIKGMLDGKLKPEDIQIDGIDTPEEIERKEKEKQAMLIKKKQQEEELRLKRKEEEKKKWWDGAELFRTHGDNLDQLEESEQIAITNKLNKYTADYSHWNTWVDETPATKEEIKLKEEEEEKKRNDEFEKNNPEFCNNFMNDIKERTKTREKKENSSNVCRLKGNNFFKQGDMAGALLQYQEALKLVPYDQKTLLNVAQVYIKQKQYDDALEFLSRTLYLNEKQAKAHSRQAFVYNELGKFEDALNSVDKGLKLDPNNRDIQLQRDEIYSKVIDERKEKELNKKHNALAIHFQLVIIENYLGRKGTLQLGKWYLDC